MLRLLGIEGHWKRHQALKWWGYSAIGYALLLIFLALSRQGDTILFFLTPLRLTGEAIFWVVSTIGVLVILWRAKGRDKFKYGGIAGAVLAAVSIGEGIVHNRHPMPVDTLRLPNGDRITIATERAYHDHIWSLWYGKTGQRYRLVDDQIIFPRFAIQETPQLALSTSRHNFGIKVGELWLTCHQRATLKPCQIKTSYSGQDFKAYLRQQSSQIAAVMDDG